MATNINLSKGSWSNVGAIYDSISSSEVKNVIGIDSNNNKIGLWSRQKAFGTSIATHIYPRVAIGCEAVKENDEVLKNLCYRVGSSKILIPYKRSYVWQPYNNPSIPTSNPKPLTYFYPVWYIADDTKHRILDSIGGASYFRKWDNTFTQNNITYYAYTKALSHNAVVVLGHSTTKVFPGHGIIRCSQDFAKHGGFTKSFRYCGYNVSNGSGVTKRHFDQVHFTSDMHQYTSTGSPVTLQVTSSDWTNLRLKIDYLDRYGQQVVSTISSNTNLTVMVGSIVYATPCLVSNYQNQHNYYAAAAVSNNSITSPTSFADNPTIYCGLLVDKVNLETNYPNSFRIVKNCKINLSRPANTSTLVSGSMYIQNSRWGSTAKTISTALHYTTIDWDKSMDSSYYPSTNYNLVYSSSGGYYFWPSTGNAISNKIYTVPGGSQTNNIDQHSSGGTCMIQIWYDSNGFINEFNLFQSTGAARTFRYYLYFV